VRTSGKGTSLSAIYDVNKIEDNEVIDVRGTLLLIPKQKFSQSKTKPTEESYHACINKWKKHRLQ